MLYSNLSEPELRTAIRQTNKAIRCARQLLNAVPEKPATTGLQLTTDTILLLIERLELDLIDLEKALAKKRKARSSPA